MKEGEEDSFTSFTNRHTTENTGTFANILLKHLEEKIMAHRATDEQRDFASIIILINIC